MPLASLPNTSQIRESQYIENHSNSENLTLKDNDRLSNQVVSDNLVSVNALKANLSAVADRIPPIVPILEQDNSTNNLGQSILLEGNSTSRWYSLLEKYLYFRVLYIRVTSAEAELERTGLKVNHNLNLVHLPGLRRLCSSEEYHLIQTSGFASEIQLHEPLSDQYFHGEHLQESVVIHNACEDLSNIQYRTGSCVQVSLSSSASISNAPLPTILPSLSLTDIQGLDNPVTGTDYPIHRHDLTKSTAQCPVQKKRQRGKIHRNTHLPEEYDFLNLPPFQVLQISIISSLAQFCYVFSK